MCPTPAYYKLREIERPGFDVELPMHPFTHNNSHGKPVASLLLLPYTGIVSDQHLLRGIVVDNWVSMETVSL